jgi:tetratricopeptide (TPR) repeat protein
MTNSTPSVETILAQAVEIAAPAERRAFVDAACAGDVELQRRVERLIANHFRAGDFLERPAVAMGRDEAAVREAARDRASATGIDRDADGDRHPACPPPSTADETGDFAPGGAAETTTQGSEEGRGPRPAAGGATPRPWPAIPGYELVKKLDQGGMGVVYLARQTGLNRLVAVKMIRAGGQARPEHFVRFRIEAEAVARLRHPHILQIFDIGEVDGLPYFSLELLEGGSLDERLAGTPQPGRQAAELMIVLGRAVHVAHEAGIVHRDLKPSNVLFTADGIPKITDLGLAKRMESDSRQTESVAIMGSPSYMAPEQARGHSRYVGPPADVYAMGAILYEMLTGRPPFKGETPIETVRQVVDDEVVPPSRLVPKVARDLETICLKCLNKDPSKRYTSALALADDLERLRDGETILARRTPALERGIKWARRRPLHAAGLAAAALVVLGLPLGAAYYEHETGRRAVGLMREGSRLEDEARSARSAAELSSVRVKLASLRDRLDREDPRRIEGLPRRIRVAVADVDRRFKDEQGREEKEKLDRAERQRLQEFFLLRYRAQLAAAEFELDPSSRQARLREAARLALAVYAGDPRAIDGDWSPADSLPEALSDAEKKRVAEGCYDLLLMLSQATTKPAVGLKVLDRASRLRPEPTAAYHLRRADCLARAGDRAGRTREERLAGDRSPVTALDHFLIGRERMGQRRWIEAIESLDRSLRLDPDQLAARLLLAIADVNVEPKRLGQARDHLDDCVRTQPELIELYLLRARVHGEEGNQALRRIESARPGDRPSLRRQAEAAFNAALDDYDIALKHLPSDDFRYVLLVNRGGMLLQAGRYEESLADLEAAVALRPALYHAHSTLGQLHQRTGRLDEASAAFGRAVERVEDPAARVALLRTRALLHADRRGATSVQRAAALHDLDEVLRLELPTAPERAEDQVNRARLFFGGGRFEAAFEASRDAIRLAPNHPAAHQLRISALMALKRYDEVLDSCDAYLVEGKPTVELLEIRGLARVARRSFSGAVADYTRALELRRDLDAATRSRLLNHRGWAYQFADAPRLALDDFEGSLALVQEQSAAHAGRGLARVRLGEWRAAVADAEAAIRLAHGDSSAGDGSRDDAQAEFNAARIYAQAVEYAAAEVGREGERAIARYRGYRARALGLLDRVLRTVTDPARREEILGDPALRPLRLAPTRATSRRRGTAADDTAR